MPLQAAEVPALPDVSIPLAHSRNRLMWITPHRVFYAGLVGEMSLRRFGGWLVYASLGAPIEVAIGERGGWEAARLAVIPPYEPHRVACRERLACSVVVEPETVAADRLPAFMRRGSGVVLGLPGQSLDDADDDPEAEAMLQRIIATHARLRDHGASLDLADTRFDAEFFGAPLPARAVDPRIARVLAALSADPSLPHGAQDCAASVGLSFSRFLHLFKQETGVSFRSLRSWKRARSLLHHVNRPANLAHLALDSGYPDSTHFSHSIRQVYGLKPRDLFAGSRRLKLLGASAGGLRQSAA